MNIENHVQSVLETLNTWVLPDEQLSVAITDQVRLLARINPDDIQEVPDEQH